MDSSMCLCLCGQTQCDSNCGNDTGSVALLSTPNRPRLSLSMFFTLQNSWLLVFWRRRRDQSTNQKPSNSLLTGCVTHKLPKVGQRRPVLAQGVVAGVGVVVVVAVRNIWRPKPSYHR
ncbi:hypothetical protein EYF80_045312 [Liparis tanakae]|uniref:Uncharacterized protein n=1 Tax=Liparis tanakae TaxID=230148 RepID=A0A4Z2FUC0_9TELE|nr:hypothetical protein EYF80_045312 [Liparis tanakae]